MADEISIPVADPAGFKVSGSRRADFEAALSEPDHGRLEVSSTLKIHDGIRVYTERKHYDVREFERNMINLDSAKAELYPGRMPSYLGKSGDVKVNITGIPGMKAGSAKPWILVGDLFYFKDKGKLVGFGAYLLDPEREKVAEGLIEIPAGDPAGFKVLSGRTFDGKREVVAERDERRTRTYYSTQWSSHLGWEVLTTRKSMEASRGGKTDFGLARAIRSYDGRDWILVGQIMTLEGGGEDVDERKFVGRLAALICSDGKVVYGAEIHVPAGNPSGYKIVKK